MEQKIETLKQLEFANHLGPTLRNKYMGLVQKVTMVANGRSHALMVIGSCGVGKSTMIIETLKAEGKVEGVDFLIIRGFTTAMAMYGKLYQNKEKGEINVIDDCDVVLKNKTHLDILKAVLDDKFRRIVSFESRRKNSDLPQQFVFTGSVIFITNLLPSEKDIHFLAVQDRCLVQNIFLNPKEKLEYLQKIIVPKDYNDSSFEVRQKIYQMMKDKIEISGSHFTFRTYLQLVDQYQNDPDSINIHLDEIFSDITESSLLIKIIKDNPNPENKKIWQDIFLQRTGLSRRSYFNYLQRIKDFLPPEVID